MYTACLTLMHHCRKRMLASVMHGACHVFSEAVLWTAQFDVFAQMPGACGSLRPHAFAALLAENLRPFAAAGQPMMMSGRPSAAACAALCGRICGPLRPHNGRLLGPQTGTNESNRKRICCVKGMEKAPGARVL